MITTGNPAEFKHLISEEKLSELKNHVRSLSLNNKISTQISAKNKLVIIADIITLIFGTERFAYIIAAYKYSRISSVDNYAREVQAFRNLIEYLAASEETQPNLRKTLQEFKSHSGLWKQSIEA